MTVYAFVCSNNTATLAIVIYITSATFSIDVMIELPVACTPFERRYDPHVLHHHNNDDVIPCRPCPRALLSNT